MGIILSMGSLTIWSNDGGFIFSMSSLRICYSQPCVFSIMLVAIFHWWFRKMIYISTIPKDNNVPCLPQLLYMLGRIRDVNLPVKSIININCQPIIPQCHTMENVIWKNLLKSTRANNSITNRQQYQIVLSKRLHLQKIPLPRFRSSF